MNMTKLVKAYARYTVDCYKVALQPRHIWRSFYEPFRAGLEIGRAIVFREEPDLSRFVAYVEENLEAIRPMVERLDADLSEAFGLQTAQHRQRCRGRIRRVK